jgi:hypothetical protein
MTEAKRDVILSPQRIGLAEYMRSDWVVNATAGTLVQDVLNPGYWAHAIMEKPFQPYDHIEVREESGLWILELTVLEVGLNWAKVTVLHKYDLADVPETPPQASLHRVEWKGPQHKHVVIRNSDNATIKDGFSKAAEAMVWMKQHEAVVV